MYKDDQQRRWKKAFARGKKVFLDLFRARSDNLTKNIGGVFGVYITFYDNKHI